MKTKYVLNLHWLFEVTLLVDLEKLCPILNKLYDLKGSQLVFPDSRFLEHWLQEQANILFSTLTKYPKTNIEELEQILKHSIDNTLETNVIEISEYFFHQFKPNNFNLKQYQVKQTKRKKNNA